MLLSAALRHRSAAPRLLHPRPFRWFSVDAGFVQAHQVYAAKSGRATIPLKFVLNGPSWPSNLEGYELGKVAAKYRKQYRELNLPNDDFQQLEVVGFAWCSNEWKWENVVVPALLKYKELHGDMHVPSCFVVPSSEPWPEEMWEMKLGSTVHMIRTSDTFVRDDPERRQVLDDMGFVWKVRTSAAEKIRDAAAHYGRVRRGAVAV